MAVATSPGVPSPTFLVTRANRDSILIRHWDIQSRISQNPLLSWVSAALALTIGMG
jgi:hypothetical protein